MKVLLHCYLLSRDNVQAANTDKNPYSLTKFLKIDILELKRIWPLVLSTGAILFVDEMVYNIGGLYGESFQLNWIFLFLYSIGLVIGSSAIAYFKPQHYKKKLSFILLTVGGLCVYLTSISPILWLVILFFTISTICFGMIFPLNEAIWSDLEDRGEDLKPFLISMSRITMSIPFIISPLVTGILSDWIGYDRTFGVVGIGIGIVGILLFIFSPKKLRLNHRIG
jgi:MFS family permease